MKKLFIVTICFFALVTSNGQIVQERLPGAEEISNRRTSFNLEEIKVRWKKAALENCPGVPCVTGPPPFTCGTSTVTDIDGNTYNTVLIGTQCWTKSNLKVTKYNDGSNIPLDASGGNLGNGSGQTWNSGVGGRTVYGHNPTNLTLYGYLYNWYAATDSRGICPTGMHVPTDAEWTTLSTFLGGQNVAGGKMKSTSTWNYSGNGTDDFGFSGLPSGYRYELGGFYGINENTFFWSSTENDSSRAFGRMLDYTDGKLYRKTGTYDGIKKDGNPIRCIKN